MHHGFCPGTRTLIGGIRKIRPHTRIIITSSDIKEIPLQRCRDSDPIADVEEWFYLSELKIIDEYIDRWNSGNVSVMALSSGFDSNLILDRALKKGILPHIISVGDNSARSEYDVVNRICSVKGINSKSFTTVNPDTFDNYGDIVKRLEGSVFEPGIFLQYELAKEAMRCGATDMICGECADQVFNVNFHEGYYDGLNHLNNENSLTEDFGFGNAPYELASSIIIKKSGIMLASFGIRGIYPYCDYEMFSVANRVAVINGKGKKLHINNCRKSMSADHFGMLKKIGGSTSLSALFRTVEEEKAFMKQVRENRLYNELGVNYSRRYGPEYDYDLIDCLCAYYIELFQNVFCIL